jgi:hypothetical protein
MDTYTMTCLCNRSKEAVHNSILVEEHPPRQNVLHQRSDKLLQQVPEQQQSRAHFPAFSVVK